MSDKDPHILLERVLKTKTAAEVTTVLEGLLASKPDNSVLTIVANAGVHQIPTKYLRGEVYEASRGDWKATSQADLLQELKQILARLVDKLRSGSWKRIYLVPTGHPVLSLQVKAMVYRVLRINTIDLYYKGGVYFEVDINQRTIALESNDTH